MPLMLALSFAFSFASQATPAFSDVSVQSSAESGEPIPVSANLTSTVPVEFVRVFYQREEWINPLDVHLNLTGGDETNGTWTGQIPAQEWGGTLEYSIVVNDGLAYYPAQGKYTIEIEGPSQSTFPWKWVIIGAFLAVVFIATELAFKPGFWRSTGRDKARALEEEDRLKEMEESKNSDEDAPKPI